MTPRILVVDDSGADVRLLQEAIREQGVAADLHAVEDGDEALAHLHSGERPDLVLLDLNLPRRDGRQVLQEIKDDPDLQHIPVVVLTTSQAEEDVLRSYQLHANAYVTKPVDFEGFIEAIKQIDHFFVSVVQLPTGRQV